MQHMVMSMDLDELPNIYKRIEKDFASGEYPPYEVLYDHLKSGVQRGFVFLQEGQETAYAVCAEGADGYVLISLFAVYDAYRGVGVGSAFLRELCNMYSGKSGIIVEVEKPELSVTEEERSLREKRIRFYEKAGYNLVADVDYSIWDIPMHLMCFR